MRCDCGCAQDVCGCEKNQYCALLRYPLPEAPKMQNIRVEKYEHPLLIFETKPCFIKEFGSIIEKEMREHKTPKRGTKRRSR